MSQKVQGDYRSDVIVEQIVNDVDVLLETWLATEFPRRILAQEMDI